MLLVLFFKLFLAALILDIPTIFYRCGGATLSRSVDFGANPVDLVPKYLRCSWKQRLDLYAQFGMRRRLFQFTNNLCELMKILKGAYQQRRLLKPQHLPVLRACVFR